MDPKELRGLYEAYSEVYAPQQIDEVSLKTKMSAFKKRATDEFESDGDNPRNYTKSGASKADKTKENIVKKHGKKAGEHAERTAHAGIFGRKSFSMPKKPTNEELDIFDVVLEFLQAEGFAETLEEAEWLMANKLDADDINAILDEEQLNELSNRKLRAYIKKSGKSHSEINKKWDQGTATDKEKSKSIGHEIGQQRAFKTLDKRAGK